MDDLISRQAAIDALAKFVPYAICDASTESYTNGLTDAYNLICQLPSVQPEPCEGAVSRQRLLSDLKELTAAWGKYPVMAEQIKGVEAAIGYVETIPSVTPERKKGKWNFIGDNMFECTYCGVAYTTQQLNGLRNYNVDPYAPKFCPNCGADMRGDQNETN